MRKGLYDCVTMQQALVMTSGREVAQELEGLRKRTDLTSEERAREMKRLGQKAEDHYRSNGRGNVRIVI